MVQCGVQRKHDRKHQKHRYGFSFLTGRGWLSREPAPPFLCCPRELRSSPRPVVLRCQAAPERHFGEGADHVVQSGDPLVGDAGRPHVGAQVRVGLDDVRPRLVLDDDLVVLQLLDRLADSELREAKRTPRPAAGHALGAWSRGRGGCREAPPRGQGGRGGPGTPWRPERPAPGRHGPSTPREGRSPSAAPRRPWRCAGSR